MQPLSVNSFEATTVAVSFALLPVAFAVAWGLAALRIRAGRPVREAWRHSLAEVGMVAGSIPLLFLGLTPREGAVAVQLVPLVDLADLAVSEPRVIVEQLAGNVLVFAAAGFFAPIRFRIGLGTIALGAAVASTALEASQYAFLAGRVVSTDDALLNTLGAVLAALASRPWWRVSRDRRGGEAAVEPGVLASVCRNWRGRRPSRFPVARTGQLVVEGRPRAYAGGAPPGSGAAEPVTAVERLGRSHLH
ncbi:VanZ family protein [Glycomyces salinus]|uniref:VanZ family protein n=1 Tax=Glycomyces salinus TaxID=980294 RepID=UPI0018EAFC8F|nr:VanZ family protein [Glycomyces salinus]